MSLTLILIRHGKSGWTDEQDDFDRTLTDRGADDAGRIGRWLDVHRLVPGVILCSSARRTRDTATALGLSGPVTPVDALYQASSDVILGHIQKQTADTVCVVGHNPGIGDLAARLAQPRPNHPRFGRYPTCATTVVTFDTDNWADITTGRCTGFTTPKDLKD